VADVNILQMSVSAGLLAVVIVIIRAVALNRLPKNMFLILWGVALCRLLVPFSFPSRYSIYGAAEGIAKILSPDSAVQYAIENVLFTGRVEAAGQTGQIAEAARERIFDASFITNVWLVGMIAAFVFFTLIYFNNRRQLRFAARINDNDFLNEWLAEHRLSRPITIMQSDRITTPFAVRLLKPRIILPKTVNMDDKQLLNYVLTHEYYHIKRCDALWKLLFVFALCVHWFNPMVWVMFILLSRDLELTCDEMVIRRFGAETKTAYAYTLIGLAEQRNKLASLYNGFSRNASEERIESIMRNKKTSGTAVAAAVLLIIGVVTVFATSAKERNNDTIGEINRLAGGNGVKQGVSGGAEFLSAGTGFRSAPVEVRNGQVYFVLDGSDTNITNYLSERTYYHYEYASSYMYGGYVHYGNDRHVVFVGGTPDEFSWAEINWSSYGEYLGSKANYNGEQAPIWMGEVLTRYAISSCSAIVYGTPASMEKAVFIEHGIIGNFDPTEQSSAAALPTREQILQEYPNIAPKVLDVVFSKQSDGSVLRLLSVRNTDERKFTEEDWAAILEAVELGLVQWGDYTNKH